MGIGAVCQTKNVGAPDCLSLSGGKWYTRSSQSRSVKGDIEKLTEEWRPGWHRVTFYGDLKDAVTELSDRLKFKLILEA